jgi:outer membrane receptor for ferrienterochelin and colicin
LKDQIIPTNPTQAAGFCVDSPNFPDTTPQFGTNLCSFIPRGNDFIVQQGAAGQFLNLSATEVEGINIAGLYRFNLPGDSGKITLRSNAFHLIKYDTSGTGTFSDRQKSAGTFNRPRWEAVSSIRFERDEFYTQATHRFQSKTMFFSGGVPATIEFAEFFQYPEQHLFDLAFGWDLESGYRMQLAITNVTDKTVAGNTGFFNTAAGTTGTYFDSLGRRFQVAVGKRF